MKSSEVSIKTRSTPASLSFKGQATKYTTVKWSILSDVGQNGVAVKTFQGILLRILVILLVLIIIVIITKN